MVKFIKVGIRIGVVILVLIMIYGGITLAIEMVQSKNEDINSEYFSVIDDIKVSENRATPSFLINDEWRYWGAMED
ncbi:hypothetical protein LVD17_09905 [Fulvivirga ulvae]|uniref:hypothetical protein n=1 Tax=Fulvivirga ulvae TaxID=2904245 RepID=UPI001F189F86|nr:hypothetical protein [Fulvivirga ulvae]UII34127.1 hypothetical protein LVD17_09905 [Fulvivirga ulvae]